MKGAINSSIYEQIIVKITCVSRRDENKGSSISWKKNKTIKFVINTRWLDGVVGRGVTTSGKLIRDT